MLLEIAIRAAREAGRILVERYRQPQQIKVKGLRDIATEADLEAERVIIDVLQRNSPEATIVAEESHQRYDRSAGLVWYIDPLDGTTNYARGLPTFSVSIAAAREGIPVCGVVFHPLLEQLFSAVRGEGAYLNGERLHVSRRSSLAQTIVLLDWPRDQRIRQESARALLKLVPRVDAVRSGGSAALSFCYIAAGWADIYYQYTLKPWDVAAGLLILEEAGGRATGLSGQSYTLHQPDWLATNGLVHQAVLDLAPFGGLSTG